MQPRLSDYTIPRVVELKTIVLLLQMKPRFPVHSSPPRKLKKCAARFLIGPGILGVNFCPGIRFLAIFDKKNV